MATQSDNSGTIVPIDFSSASELPALHANNVLIQHTDHEFVLTFFEVLPPVITPDPARQARELARIRAVPARAVARIVMSPGRAKEFVAALQNNLEQYMARSEQPAEK